MNTQISDFNYMIVLTVVHMYFWVLMYKKILEQPRDWVSIILVAFAFVAVGRILNDLIREMQLPLTVTIMFFLVYVGLDLRVYYDWKKQKK